MKHAARTSNSVWCLVVACSVFLSLGSVPAFCEDGMPQDAKAHRTEYLKPADGRKLFSSTVVREAANLYSAPCPGGIWVKGGSSKVTSLTVKRSQEVFPEVRTKEQAQEMCELLHWMTLIEDQAAFDGVLAAYKKAGYPVRPTDQKRVYGSVTRRTADGFMVELTAYVIIPHRMAPQAAVQRVHYSVGNDGSVEPVKRVTYLPGPYLTWQTGTLDTKASQEAQTERLSMKNGVLRGVYDQLSVMLRRSRSAGPKGSQRGAVAE